MVEAGLSCGAKANDRDKEQDNHHSVRQLRKRLYGCERTLSKRWSSGKISFWTTKILTRRVTDSTIRSTISLVSPLPRCSGASVAHQQAACIEKPPNLIVANHYVIVEWTR